MADYTANDFGPRKQANKQQEMAVRRAFELNAALMDALKTEGTLDKVKEAGRYLMVTDKRLREFFSATSPEYRHKDVWSWVVDHWYSGALKRSVEVTMNYNISDANRKSIKGKIDELYG